MAANTCIITDTLVRLVRSPLAVGWVDRRKLNLRQSLIQFHNEQSVRSQSVRCGSNLTNRVAICATLR
ncbi:hypothetical protein NC997_25425 [Trichocoleus sp. DQ-A2]